MPLCCLYSPCWLRCSCSYHQTATKIGIQALFNLILHRSVWFGNAAHANWSQCRVSVVFFCSWRRLNFLVWVYDGFWDGIMIFVLFMSKSVLRSEDIHKFCIWVWANYHGLIILWETPGEIKYQHGSFCVIQGDLNGSVTLALWASGDKRSLI